MRVLVACDAMAGLGPRGSSEVVARAFAEVGAQVAVIPVATNGEDLVDALTTIDEPTELRAVTGLSDLFDVLEPGPGALVLDLTAAVAPRLDDLVTIATDERLAAARAALAGRRIVALVPHGAEQPALTGLSGAIAELGRLRNADLGETLAEDSRAEAWAHGLGLDPTAPATGALGGLGALVLGLGGEVDSVLGFCLRAYGAADVMAQADVVVTGAAQLDFHAVGGAVVTTLSAMAAEALRPVIVVAGRTFVSARELRLAGIESAYPVLTGTGDDVPDADQLLATARKVAATWRW